jgi:hypothetical protein
MRDNTPLNTPLMTPKEAFEVAQARGIRINLETVRRVAKLNGLTIRLGGRHFIQRQGWMQLLETGQPDTMPVSRARHSQASA